MLPSIVAAQPPASPPRAPRRPISSRWRLPSHHSTASAVFRPNQSPTLHGPSDRSAGGNSTPPPSPLTSNPHSPALPSRLPHPRDFVPWRFSDACRRRAPTPASPLGRPTNLHMKRHSPAIDGRAAGDHHPTLSTELLRPRAVHTAAAAGPGGSTESNDRRQPDGRCASMIDRAPLERDARRDGKPEKRGFHATSGSLRPALPLALERRIVGLQEPAFEGSRPE